MQLIARGRRTRLVSGLVKVAVSRASKPLPHLRAVLVATGTLPTRDEHFVQLEHRTARIIAVRTDPQEKELLHRYGVWHVLRRLRQRIGGAQAAHAQADVARRNITAAVAFLDWLTARDLRMATCRQGDLDRWTSEASISRRGNTGHFVRWARNQNLTGLDFPATRWGGPTRIIDTGNDQVRLQLGPAPILLPEPIDAPLLHLVGARHGHATIGDRGTSRCLLPGGRPGQPISPSRLGERLHQIGIQPGQARSTALFQLATELPAALLARMLGIHIDVAVAWQHLSSGDWMAYAGDVSTRARPQRADPAKTTNYL